MWISVRKILTTHLSESRFSHEIATQVPTAWVAIFLSPAHLIKGICKMKFFALLVLAGSLMVFGCGKRKTTPPPEVDTEVSELEIDFGDEFMPFDDDTDSFDVSIGE